MTNSTYAIMSVNQNNFIFILWNNGVSTKYFLVILVRGCIIKNALGCSSVIQDLR